MTWGSFFLLFRAALAAHGSSQVRGWIRATAAWSMPRPQQHRIWATSSTYTTAHGNAESLTHWARQPTWTGSSWILVGFVTAELPKRCFYTNMNESHKQYWVSWRHVPVIKDLKTHKWFSRSLEETRICVVRVHRNVGGMINTQTGVLAPSLSGECRWGIKHC